jgi:uncharacterized protein (TIGR02246 family)
MPVTDYVFGARRRPKPARRTEVRSAMIGSICRLIRRFRAASVWTLIFGATLATSAAAATDADELAISQRLQRWTAAFNARDAAGTCDLFAPELIATFRGGPDRGRDAVCRRIADALGKASPQLHNALDIREIIVSGDIAVVRLVWTLTVRKGTTEHSSKEPGIDIFKRQSDGTWSIIRYLAFSTDRD